MFWCEKLKEGETFCVCEAGWLEIKISDVVFFTDTLKLLVQPEYGVECTIIHIRNGEVTSHLNNFRMQFQSMQHVKFKVEGKRVNLDKRNRILIKLIDFTGGEITLFGSIFPHSNVIKRKENEYPILCPFGAAELLNISKRKHPEKLRTRDSSEVMREQSRNKNNLQSHLV